MKYVPDEIAHLLKNSGVDWRIEIGRKHRKIFVGKRLAGILPLTRNPDVGRHHKNTVAQVRRAIKEQAND